MQSPANLAASAGPDPRTAAFFQLFLIGLVVFAVIAVFAEITTFLGTLWDDLRGWAVLLAALGFLIWALASHNKVVAIISGITAAADLIGIIFHLR